MRFDTPRPGDRFWYGAASDTNSLLEVEILAGPFIDPLSYSLVTGALPAEPVDWNGGVYMVRRVDGPKTKYTIKATDLYCWGAAGVLVRGKNSDTWRDALKRTAIAAFKLLLADVRKLIRGQK